jgi:hypothetical protein
MSATLRRRYPFGGAHHQQHVAVLDLREIVIGYP